MKSVAAVLLMAWCGCVQADVYKWTDARGEVHFGENPPAATASEKVMTQEQIDRTERADKAVLPSSQSAAGQSMDDAVPERLAECRRFKSLRDDFLMNVDPPSRSLVPLMGYNVGYVTRENEENSGIMDFNEIEANIRKYCQE